MKIKDVYSTYGRQIDAYSEKIRKLNKQKNDLESEIKEDPKNAKTLKRDYDKLELSINALRETRDKYSAFTEKVAEMQTNLHNRHSMIIILKILQNDHSP